MEPVVHCPQLERAREQLRRQGDEQVLVGVVLVDDLEPDDHREHERVGHERRHLAAPHRARNDHEDRYERDQQRELLQRQHELPGVVQIAGIEHDAQKRARKKRAHCDVDARDPKPGRRAGAGRERDQPDHRDDREHDPIERDVDRRVHPQLDPVERREPDHRDQARDRPRQQPRRSRPVRGGASA